MAHSCNKALSRRRLLLQIAVVEAQPLDLLLQTMMVGPQF